MMRTLSLKFYQEKRISLLLSPEMEERGEASARVQPECWGQQARVGRLKMLTHPRTLTRLGTPPVTLLLPDVIIPVVGEPGRPLLV